MSNSSFTRDRVKTMIYYATKMPSETDSHDRAYKLPFVASEILSSGVTEIYDMFFTAPSAQSDKKTP